MQGALASFRACHAVWQHIQELVGGRQSHLFSLSLIPLEKGLREVWNVSATHLCLQPSQAHRPHFYTADGGGGGRGVGGESYWQAPE